MKFAQKMMLVPAGRVPLEVSALSELDQAMTNVINNKSLSPLEKINLYSNILKKNLTIEERLKGKNIQTKLTGTQKEIPNIENEIKQENIKNEGEDKEENEVEDMEISKNLGNLSIFSPTNYSDIVKKLNPLPIIKTELVENKTQKDVKSNIQEKTPFNTSIQKMNLRNKSLSFEHNYPQDTYTGVGHKKNNPPKKFEKKEKTSPLNSSILWSLYQKIN